MVFSFHHSKPEAWLSIYHAITDAQFSIVAAHPVKAEMAVSKTKAATANPINIDAIIVCKKENQPPCLKSSPSEVWLKAQESYQQYYQRLWKTGRILSNGDQYVLLSSQILVYASLSGLSKTQAQQLLLQAYKLESSQNKNNAKEEDAELSREFWKQHLVTEQKCFAFITG